MVDDSTGDVIMDIEIVAVLFDLKKRTNNGKFFVFKGDLEKNFNMTPTGFRLSRK